MSFTVFGTALNMKLTKLKELHDMEFAVLGDKKLDDVKISFQFSLSITSYHVRKN